LKETGSNGSSAIAQATERYAAGDYRSALDILVHATVGEDAYLDLAYLLGLCYARLERFDEALLYLEQVVTQGLEEARTFQCRMALALVYSATGRSKLAEYELKKLVESSSETSQVCAALGHANWKQGRVTDSLAWYEKSLALDPENPTALNGYGYVLASSGRELEKALACCRKALDDDPENPAYADSIGWVYFKLGRMEEAGRYLHAAAELLGDSDESIEHVDVYEKALDQQ
jgi:tetratricopeptide (TPR) repeat protein